jgi:hypothetical protein
MAVADDIASIDADEARTPEQRRKARYLRKAEAYHDLLAKSGERTFSRGQFAVTISDVELLTVDDVPQLKMSLVVRRGGTVRFKDEWVVVNPPIKVRVGEEPNPEHDPEDRASPPTRPVYAENVREAMRSLVAKLIEGQLR